MKPTFILKLIPAIGFFMLTMVPSSPLRGAELPVESPSLNTAVWQAAKKSEGWLRDHQCSSVAVLKFDTYFKDERKMRHDMGPIHINLSRRLERGLIVVQRPKDIRGQPQSEIVVALDANAIAAKTQGADLNTAEGRSSLCTANFRPAWGTGTLRPDAFITGLLRFEKSGSQQVTLIVMGYCRESPEKVEKIGEFPADLAIQDMIDAGHSFTTRGAFSSGKIEVNGAANAESPITPSQSLEQALALAAVQQPTQMTSPSTSATSPVRLRIFYNDREQTVERVGNELVVPEPMEGTRISVIVERSAADRPRLGIVLKVNGENSFGREREPDLKCTKWVMEPKMDRFAVRGFQLDLNTHEDFRVGGVEESRRVENQFGTDIGTISMTVFGEQSDALPQIDAAQLVQGTRPIAPLPKEIDPNNTRPLDLLAIAEGVTPAEPSPSRAISQRTLREAGGATRGVILPGESKVIHVDSTTFRANPLLLMTTTVHYYRKSTP